MQEPSLCVIVPVFNMVKYIRTCVDSLLNQTYKNLHIVLVNDCSTDNSLSILKEYARKYPNRITVIDSKENLRQGGARNLGIKATDSDYIGFVDADDFVHPQMYEYLMNEANQNKADAIYCSFQNVTETATLNNLIKDNHLLHKTQIEYIKLNDENRLKIMTNPKYGSVWGGIYSRKIIIDNNIFFPEHLLYEDNYWVYILQLHLKTISIISQKLYYYRQQSNSTVHKKNAIHHYDGIEISKRFLSYVKEKNLLLKYHNIIEYIFLKVFTLNQITRFLNSFDKPEIAKITFVKLFLKKEFPKWRANNLYKEKFTFSNKLKTNLIMLLPTKLLLEFYNIYSLMRKINR